MDINFTSSSNAAATKIEIGTGTAKAGVVEGADLEPNTIIKAVEEVERSASEEPELDEEELQNLVEDLSSMMSVMRKGLAFKIDEDSGTSVVSVMDIESGDLIRQIPNEEALKLARKLTEVTGVLMKTEA
ncbi:flagellar protein FlaG [Shewanella psychropiezotolerans]|uniref:Flagellar protein FlaG n=1 Tax=Shewanella psychropiezotolerans TaxID=2593655 RepID=A0ABX5WWJ0_9GAMM|nr:MULTISPECIES: flagellar protein FlaG [Shewanella]MPY24911.1 flagellar protein FlaG [Shewanella sp. YLB-07]QDO83456.1 flagellar protein FlaG [Shewanella psychropiezotolerans]